MSFFCISNERPKQYLFFGFNFRCFTRAWFHLSWFHFHDIFALLSWIVKDLCILPTDTHDLQLTSVKCFPHRTVMKVKNVEVFSDFFEMFSIPFAPYLLRKFDPFWYDDRCENNEFACIFIGLRCGYRYGKYLLQ